MKEITINDVTWLILLVYSDNTEENKITNISLHQV